MTDTTPDFTPEQAAAATDPQRQEAPAFGASVPAPLLAGAARAAAGPAQVDVAALEERLNMQIEALAREVTRLRQGGAAGGVHPLQGTAKAIRDMLATHFLHRPGDDGSAVLRLADDTVDAAANAVESGDTSTVRDLAGRLERAINRAHPGPGDHHWIRQALDFTRNHLLEAADTVTGPSGGGAAAAIGSSAPPAQVVAGSVTGEVSRQPLPAPGQPPARGAFPRS